MEHVERFALAYLEAAEFCGFDVDMRGSVKWDAAAMVEALSAAAAFLDKFPAEMLEAARIDGLDSIECAARDLWYTRNGHGAGFWDGDWKDAFDAAASEYARNLGPRSCWVGDGGAAYFDIG